MKYRPKGIENQNFLTMFVPVGIIKKKRKMLILGTPMISPKDGMNPNNVSLGGYIKFGNNFIHPSRNC
jgi:hypothetical protein